MYNARAAEGAQEEANYMRDGYRHPKNDPYSPTYNPRWRNHPNFRHGNDSNFQNQYQNQSHASYGNAPQNSSQNSYSNQNSYGNQSGPPPGYQNGPSNFQNRGPPAPPKKSQELARGSDGRVQWVVKED